MSADVVAEAHLRFCLYGLVVLQDYIVFTLDFRSFPSVPIGLFCLVIGLQWVYASWWSYFSYTERYPTYHHVPRVSAVSLLAPNRWSGQRRVWRVTSDWIRLSYHQNSYKNKMDHGLITDYLCHDTIQDGQSSIRLIVHHFASQDTYIWKTGSSHAGWLSSQGLNI